MEKIPRFVSIREAAKLGVLSEYALRRMQRNGRLPGVYSGVKFLINLDVLLEQLNQPTNEEVKR